jgi:mannose-6-phosphate isomerase-like protein (cupin superfamily)
VLDAPGAEFVVAEWRDPGGPPDPPRLIAPPHVHHRDDEAWYVLEGTLRFRLGEREVTAAAGSAVLAARGTPHTFWNPAPEPARYLLVMTRAIFRLIEDLHALPERTPEAVLAVFARYDSELVE